MAENARAKKIEEKIRKLPLNLRREVEEFVDSLMEPSKRKARKPLELKWRGDLRDLRDKYTSVTLQHQILEWWGD